jgi:predicted lipid-binding transport protein (Tim44 family)
LTALAVIYVRDNGLPWWQVLPLTVVGIGLAMGLLRGGAWLLAAPERRRLAVRVRDTEAVAGAAPPYDPATVRAAAERLFAAMWTAWDADDLATLERISDPGMFSDWSAELAGYRAHARRFRASIRKGPSVAYLELDREREYVRVRIRARLRAWVEAPDGGKRPVAGNSGQTWRYAYDWTLSRRDGDWVVYSIRGAGPLT